MGWLRKTINLWFMESEHKKFSKLVAKIFFLTSGFKNEYSVLYFSKLVFLVFSILLYLLFSYFLIFVF